MDYSLTRIILMALALLVVCPVCAVEATPEASLEQQTISPQQERNQRELKVMLWMAIIVLSGLFVFVFTLFIIRMARSARGHHLDKKRTHTKYIDAWGQYRLPDDLDYQDGKK